MYFKLFSPVGRALMISALAFTIVLPAVAIPAEMAEDILPLSQVKPGMRGYGLTVFKGTQVEKFDVEVIGVLPKINNGHALILIRAGGGTITQRQTNIIGGMSGSPVYVNNKLIGAVAYGSGFSKEPLGMLTPIEDMMEAFDPNLPTRPSNQSSELIALPLPVTVGGKTFENIRFTNWTDERTTRPTSTATLTMIPLATPLMISGMSARGIERIAPLFEQFNLMPMPGPGKLQKKIPVSLQPGSSVGVGLTTGDVEITGVGTLTYIKGDKVLAMGHPYLGAGPLSAVLTTAYVHEIIPSLLFSTKVVSPIEVVGKTVQDRLFSISGELGEPPAMIPVTITVRDFAFKRGDRFNVNVINNPLLSPSIIVAVVSEAIYRVHSVPGDAVAKVSFEVEADEVGKVKRENMYFDELTIDMTAVNELAQLMSLLSRNRFYPVDVKRVSVNVEVTGKRNTAQIDRIFVPKTKYEPGDDVEVGVLLRPYKSPLVTRTMKVRIPPTLSSCKVNLVVSGGGRGAIPIIIEKSDESDGTPPVRGGSYSESTAENLRQLVDKFLERERNNELTAKLILPDSAIVVGGEKLTSLPPVVAEAFRNAKSTGLKQQREEVKSVEPTDWIVVGSQSLSITVEKRDSSEKPGAPPSSESRPPLEESSSSAQSMLVVVESDEEEYSAQTDLEPIALSPMALQPPPGVKIVVASPVPPPFLSQPTEQPKVEVEPKKEAKNGTAEKSVARQMTIWTQTTQKDFVGGKFDGVSATSADDLRPAPKISLECKFDDTFIWSILPCDNGAVVVGTGNSALVYRVEKGGKPSVLADLPELEVHSLARSKSGEIYAGTAPEGRVYKIAADGQAEVLFDADEKYITALVTDSKGSIFAGTGDAPKVYRIDPKGKSEAFAELPGQYVLSLATDVNDTIYAGVGGSGAVYAIKPDGTRTAVYDAGDRAVTSIQTDGKGALYVATAPKGLVTKIEADGKVKPLYSKASKSALGLVLWPAPAKSTVAVLYGDKACLVSEDEVVEDIDNGEHVQFTALAVSPDGDVYIGSSNSAALYTYHPSQPKATYESVAHDAKVQSSWGRIRWTAEIPDGAKLTFQTRSGNASEPDETWSAWSPAYVESGQRVLSPPARYIQYRAVLEAVDWKKCPALKDVSISFLTRNQSPAVKIAAPTGGEAWARKQTVKWSGQDPDGDTLTYRVFYSSDFGKTWQELFETKGEAKTEEVKPPSPSPPKDKEEPKKEDISEEKPAEVTADSSKASDSKPGEPEISLATKSLPGRPAAKTADEKAAKKPDAPPSSPPAPPVPPPAPAKPTLKGPGKNTSYSWNTTKVADGNYLVKVAASDASSNAKDALTHEKITEPITICNTPPTLLASERDLKVIRDRFAALTGSASSALVRITGVDYRVDSEDWRSSEPVDGMFDSPFEEFRIATGELSSGEHDLEVKAIDAAGNASTEKLKVKIGG